MKKSLFLLAAFAIVALTSCDKNDGGGRFEASLAAKEALAAKYPGASDIVWRPGNGFSVAEFRDGSSSETLTAWFDNGGRWYMTETDIAFDALPQAVKTAFAGSEYASWHVDDVDRLDRDNAETIFVIEAESTDGRSEVELCYSVDGVLVKTLTDTDNDYDDFIPSTPSPAIGEFIAEHYPDARIVEIDREKGMTEVGIIDGRVFRELLFDASGNWVRTSTELRPAELPAQVTAAVAASEYAGFEIDDAEFVETPSGEYYLLELENGDREAELRVAADGTILKQG